jgi:hypothetical protein
MELLELRGVQLLELKLLLESLQHRSPCAV